MATRLMAAAHRFAEWTLMGSRRREDPWGEITVTAVMTGPGAEGGKVLRVPAFWDGGETWRVRLMAAGPGMWQVRTECSDASDAGLQGQTATLEVGPADAA